jgi:hypothetical protein
MVFMQPGLVKPYFQFHLICFFFFNFSHTLTTPFHFVLGWAAMFALAIIVALISFFHIMLSCLIFFFKRVMDG